MNVDLEKKTTVLKSCILFSKLDKEKILEITQQLDIKSFAFNETIFDEGDEADGLYIIVDGNVKICKLLKDSEKQQAVAVLKENDFFGDMALIDEEKRSASAICVTPTSVLFMSRALFDDLIRRDTHTAYLIFAQLSVVMSKRIRKTNNLFREILRWGVTARNEIESLKSTFLRTISHELRTPIHAIQGFSSILKESADLDPETKDEFVAVILKESHRLANLINDLISLSEIEFGATIIHKKDANVTEAVTNAFKRYEPLAAEHKIDLNLKTPDQPILAKVDAKRLEQAICNLIENAIKFTDEGGAVTVSLEETAEKIQVHITDTGIGIADEHLEKIFEDFYQVDQGLTRKFEGTGIGLNLSKKIVELHSGKILVSSTQKKGSTFTIDLDKAKLAAAWEE